MASRWHLLILLALAQAACLAAPGAALKAGGAAASAEALLSQLQALQQRIDELEARGTPGAPPRPLLPPRANLQRTLASRPDSWSAAADFLTAVAADARATAAAALPTPSPPGRGLPRRFVLGDADGRLYFFSPDGHLLYEHAPPAAAAAETNSGAAATAVTALAACPSVGNRTAVAVGRAGGSIEILSVLHDSPSGSSSSADAGGGTTWRAGSGPGPAVYAVEPLLLFTAADRATAAAERSAPRQRPETGAGEAAADGEGETGNAGDSNEESYREDGGLASAAAAGAAIVQMQCFRAGGRAIAVAADAAGQVTAIPEDGGPPLLRELGAWPLALRSSALLTVALTARQAAVTWLRPGRSVVRRPCAGLEGPTDALLAATFDPARNYRAYGYTEGGDLVLLAVPSERKAVPCRALARVPLGLPPGPVALAATASRLLLSHPAGVAAFSTTGPLHRTMAPVGSQLWPDVWRELGLARFAASGDGSSSGGDAGTGAAVAVVAPLLATAGQLVVTGLGPESVAVFDAESAGSSSGSSGSRAAAAGGRGGGGGGGGGPMISSEWLKVLQPFLLIGMISVGVWQFRRASRGPGGGSYSMRRRGAGGAADLWGDLGGGGAGGIGGLGRGLDDIYGGGFGGYGGGYGGSFARRRQQQQGFGGGGGGGGGLLRSRGSGGGSSDRPGGLRRRGYGGGGGGYGGGGLLREAVLRGQGAPTGEGFGDEPPPGAAADSGGSGSGGEGFAGDAAAGGGADGGGGGAEGVPRRRRTVGWRDPLAEYSE